MAEIENACFPLSDENISSTEISIYPNPARNSLKISSDEILNYAIYDVNGKLRSTGKSKPDSTIKIESLEAGLYFFKVENKSFRFIKI